MCTWHAADKRSCSCPGQETSASRRGEPTHGGWLAARNAGRAQRRARTVRPTYTFCRARKRGRAQRLGNADSAPNVSFPLACRTTGPTGPTWDMQDIRSTFGLSSVFVHVYVYGSVVPSLLHTVPGRSTRGGVRVVGPCVSYTPSGYESRRRVFAVCGDRSGRERVPRLSSRRVLVVHRADIFHRTLRARPLMAPDVDLRSTAIALRPGRIQPIGKRAESESLGNIYIVCIKLCYHSRLCLASFSVIR